MVFVQKPIPPPQYHAFYSTYIGYVGRILACSALILHRVRLSSQCCHAMHNGGGLKTGGAVVHLGTWEYVKTLDGSLDDLHGRGARSLLTLQRGISSSRKAIGGIPQTGNRLTKHTDAGHAYEYIGLQCLGMFQTMLEDVCG